VIGGTEGEIILKFSFLDNWADSIKGAFGSLEKLDNLDEGTNEELGELVKKPKYCYQNNLNLLADVC
jgi:hypothetical protein